MGREIRVDEDAVRIRYRGLSTLITLLREVNVPYAEIQSVEVGLGPLPRASFRIGESVPGGTVRGRFRVGGRWYFLDLHHRERAIVITTLPGARFALVAVEPEADIDPAELAASIRERL